MIIKYKAVSAAARGATSYEQCILYLYTGIEGYGVHVSRWPSVLVGCSGRP